MTGFRAVGIWLVVTHENEEYRRRASLRNSWWMVSRCEDRSSHEDHGSGEIRSRVGELLATLLITETFP